MASFLKGSFTQIFFYITAYIITKLIYLLNMTGK